MAKRDPVPAPGGDPAGLALALARLPGVGRRRLRRLLIGAGGLEINDAAELLDFLARHAYDVGLDLPTQDACLAAWDEGRRIRELCWRRNWHVWTVGAPDYPSQLERLEDPPAMLFVHGPPRLPATPRLAIVGTREPTPWGEATARGCARTAVEAGAIVVSGLAWGIDTAAHLGAVDHGGLTWAVLPGGLDIIYPGSNRALAARIVDGGGALVSEYLPGTRARPTFFVERDRLQAALSDTLLVVETGRTGGTHHTIRFARALEVPVWITLPPDVVTDASAGERLPTSQQGTWDLWRGGARLVTADEVAAWASAHEGGGPGPVRPAPAQARLF